MRFGLGSLSPGALSSRVLVRACVCLGRPKLADVLFADQLELDGEECSIARRVEYAIFLLGFGGRRRRLIMHATTGTNSVINNYLETLDRRRRFVRSKLARWQCKVTRNQGYVRSDAFVPGVRCIHSEESASFHSAKSEFQKHKTLIKILKLLQIVLVFKSLNLLAN